MLKQLLAYFKFVNVKCKIFTEPLHLCFSTSVPDSQVTVSGLYWELRYCRCIIPVHLSDSYVHGVSPKQMWVCWYSLFFLGTCPFAWWTIRHSSCIKSGATGSYRQQLRLNNVSEDCQLQMSKMLHCWQHHNSDVNLYWLWTVSPVLTNFHIWNMDSYFQPDQDIVFYHIKEHWHSGKCLFAVLQYLE